MNSRGSTRLARLLIGAIFALLVQIFCVGQSAHAGCAHPTGSRTPYASELSSLPRILGEFLDGSAAGQGSNPAQPHRRFPCSGPSCSGNVPLPVSPGALAADRVDQWGTLSSLFDVLPIVPRFVRISDTSPRPIGQPSPVFHPPRTNRSIVL